MSLNEGSSNIALLVNTMPIVAAILMSVHAMKFLLACPVGAGCCCIVGESSFSYAFSFAIWASRSRSLSEESTDPLPEDMLRYGLDSEVFEKIVDILEI